MKAAESDRSLSDLLNQAIRVSLAEDLDDAEAVDARRDEPARPFEDFLKELRDAGDL